MIQTQHILYILLETTTENTNIFNPLKETNRKNPKSQSHQTTKPRICHSIENAGKDQLFKAIQRRENAGNSTGVQGRC